MAFSPNFLRSYWVNSSTNVTTNKIKLENQSNESEEDKYKKWEYATVAMQQRGHSIVIVYFIGLIDILTQYDLKKFGENAIKSLRYGFGNKGISAIPPKPYRIRFMKYISSIIDWNKLFNKCYLLEIVISFSIQFEKQKVATNAI